MKTILYKASSRGNTNHGWLNTYHTFSFANYYDPSRINFGALRVINDDLVEGSKGFGTHPHNNMEIISIPLHGDIEHKDSMGHTSTIHTGEVQVMSAGKGLTHSEYNPNKDKSLNLFQIWVLPNKQDVEPRYDQKAFDFIQRRNQLIQVVKPKDDETGEGLWIHQNAWFQIGTFDKNSTINYKIKRKENGFFVMVIEGEFTVEGQKLNNRDGLGVWQTDSISITADSNNARILLMDVPMIF